MIVTDLYEASQSGSKTIHQLIADSIGTYPEVIVDPIWREYALGEMVDQVGANRRAALGLRTATTPMQNLVRQCIRQITGRIKFRRFVVDHEETQEWLDTYATKNKIPAKAIAIGRNQLTDGNAAMSQVWRGGADGMAIVRQEYWMDARGLGMFVGVGDTGDPAWAVSEYIDNDDVRHRVLYLPDRIITYSGGDIQGEGWKLVDELDWTQADNTTPIGVAASHFPGPDMDYGPYGSSTVREVIPMQDSLNLSLFNRMAVSAATGQQILWASGVKEPDDKLYGPGMLLSSPDPASRFGAIPPGEITSLIQETDDIREIICGAFPVPSYRLGGGEWPSGLALQRSDGPMLTMARLVRDTITGGLVHHAHRATVMKNTFGGGNLNTEALISVEWEPLDELDPSTEVEIQQARAEVLSLAESLSEVSLRKLGMFTEKEIEEILAEREEMEEDVAVVNPEDDEESF